MLFAGVRGLNRRVDVIQSLRALLDPLVEQTPFVLDQVAPLDAQTGRTYGVLEYHGTLSDGRIVLLGFYQYLAPRTIAAELWVPGEAPSLRAAAGSGAIVRHRQVWTYGPDTDTPDLVRAIVAEVASWLQSFDPTAEWDPVTHFPGD
jgi:hypothetical protein